MIRNRLALILSVVVLAGCASAGAEGEMAGQPPAATDNSALAGMVFETNIAPGQGVAGDWRVVFNDAGRVIAHHQGRQVYEGDYAVSGGELRITNRRGTYGCGGRAAVYNFSVRDGMLNLTRRDDPCSTMSTVFQNGRWERR
jgi:hypothetical protein